eukprot:1161531-Pelagomonas_calceolata.AAC.11
MPYVCANSACSDGTEVLRHMDGSEPAAAQALRQVLQQFSAAAQDRQQATAEASSSSSSSSACSFLAALLGPKMADIAMGRAHKARWVPGSQPHEELLQLKSWLGLFLVEGCGSTLLLQLPPLDGTTEAGKEGGMSML